MALVAEKSETRAPAHSASGGDLLPASQAAAFLLCPHVVEGPGSYPGSLLLRALIPFTEAPVS